ncbi:TetR/AcrR family transcriptional regulator [Lysinibacillus sp. BW-2-10]|uniref:TetR/AcrR family transcriptional regulator n=1 Tax=Lysinibacillus sp. BW-2-10 TaxID=2590030 RepID=UPI00117FAE3F|nr:TetR/AcrR family transcriptional regulator [Lysinibacillus sp. BW-2-10]TSI10757.1 TetR/AcrR family transcriptional regulator [Lysinibacillus sp. BW-2-10]
MSKRGRKKGSSGEVSRALLLNMAVEEFALNGYHETKISTIVERAGVTQKTFYLYFNSKEAIFQELITKFREKLSTIVSESRLEATMDKSDIVNKLFKMLQFFAENSYLTQIGFYLSEESIEIKKQLLEQISNYLNAGAKGGYFRSNVDMDFVAESLLGMIERLTQTQLFSGLKGPQQLAEEIAMVVLKGIASREKEQIQ